MTALVLPVVVVAIAILIVARRRKVHVPRTIMVERVQRVIAVPAEQPAPATRTLANGTPPSQTIPLALRDDDNLVATPAVIIGLKRVRRGNAARAASSGEIESEATRERTDDTLPTIIVDEK